MTYISSKTNIDESICENKNIANEITETNERKEKWDNIKGILIFLVVLGHILELYINNNDATLTIKRMRFFIYTFHMPLFLFISGLFSKKNIDNKRYLNIFYYLVLFYVVKIILFLKDIILYKKYSLSMFSESEVPWYVFSLFVFNIITIPISKLNKKFVLISSIILGCIVGYDNNISDFLCMSRIVVFYPFFLAGYYLDADKLEKILSKKLIKIFSCLVILLFITVVYIKIKDIYWITPLLSGRNPYHTLNDKRSWGAILRLIYYFVVLCIGISIISLTPSSNKKIKLFSNIGKKTLSIYALHYPILCMLFFGIINVNTWIENLNFKYSKLLLIPIAFVITWILSLEIFNKPFMALKNIWINKKIS